jgi:hypothetical protein
MPRGASLTESRISVRSVNSADTAVCIYHAHQLQFSTPVMPLVKSRYEKEKHKVFVPDCGGPAYKPERIQLS